MDTAPYAEWPDFIPIKKITQRYFLGWCKEERRFREAIATVNAKRDEAMALINDFPPLDESYRKKALSYLEKSYKNLNNEGYLKRNVLGRCRGDVIKG